MDVNTTFILACIGILSLLCQWLAWRVRVPAILFLLAAGILVGPVVGVLVPEAVFGGLLFPLISLSVAIILFEGSLTLRFNEIKGHGNMVRNLIPAGTLVTCLIGTLATRWALGLT
jgi:NhaP-type Na+/H+ or K+/H+ antiporter